MKHTDLARAAELTTRMAQLEIEVERIAAGTFSITAMQLPVDERTGALQPRWEAASVLYPEEEGAVQVAARNAFLALKRAALERVRAELRTMGVNFDDPLALPALPAPIPLRPVA